MIVYWIDYTNNGFFQTIEPKWDYEPVPMTDKERIEAAMSYCRAKLGIPSPEQSEPEMQRSESDERKSDT